MSDGRYYVGADIGGTTVKLGLFDAGNGDWIRKWETDTDRSDNGAHIFSDIVTSIKEACILSDVAYNNISGIGIGVPGPVLKDGTVNGCANLGWGAINVRNIMRELTGVYAIAVANDANVAALGEKWKGGGKDFSNLVMVTLGTGVGGGIIMNGRIYEGSFGAAGEFGHMKVGPYETCTCGCGGTGCLEQYASATGIVRLYNESTHQEKCSGAKDVFELAANGDEKAYSAIDTAMRYLGMALSNVAAVIDPQAFIIGGGVSKAGDMLIDMLSRYYNMYSMGPLRNRKFIQAVLSNDAGIYGCVRLAMDNDQMGE